MNVFFLFFLSLIFFVSACTSCQQTNNTLITLDSLNDSTTNLVPDTLEDLSNLNFINDTINNISRESREQISFTKDSLTCYTGSYFNTFIQLPYTQINQTLLEIKSIPVLVGLDTIEASTFYNTGPVLYYKTANYFYFSDIVKPFKLVSGKGLNKDRSIFFMEPKKTSDTTYSHLKAVFTKDSMHVTSLWSYNGLSVPDSIWNKTPKGSSLISYEYDNDSNLIGFRNLNATNVWPGLESDLCLYSKVDDVWYFSSGVLYPARRYDL